MPATSWDRVYEALTSSDVSMQSVIRGRRQLLDKAELAGVWPERLLHVESMTSVRKAPDDSYLGIRRPAFTVLSYKWGLWVVKNGSRLEVKDITWEIPAIDPKRWTTAQLKNVITRLAQDIEFVWIDVACIDQYVEEDTMREILEEPRMFRQASQAFVWLVDFDSDVLEHLLNKISAAADILLEASMEPSIETDLQLLPSTLNGVFVPLSTLLNNSPWFKSNWTMREIMLCSQIVILNREGRTVPIHQKNGSPAVIDSIATVCATMLAWLQQVQRQAPALFHSRGNGGVPTGSLDVSEKISDTTIDLVTKCLRLVEMHGALFLYSSQPAVLHYWTTQLLTTGVLMVQGMAGDDVHNDCGKLRKVQAYHGEIQQYHGWGDAFRIPCTCSRLCGCWDSPEQGCKKKLNKVPRAGKAVGSGGEWTRAKCMPCVLEISYRVGDTDVDSRTWFRAN